jgi:hypothetical protein
MDGGRVKTADRESIGQMPRKLGSKPVFCPCVTLPDAMLSVVPLVGAAGSCVQKHKINEENAK